MDFGEVRARGFLRRLPASTPLLLRRILALTLLVMAVLLSARLTVAAPAASAQDGSTNTTDPAADDGNVPGGGEVIRMGRATWDTGWFQSEILAQLLTELGYQVDGPRTMDNDDFYAQVADGSVDLWVNGWFPLHDELLADGSEPLGFEVRGGALQGYLADIATVDRLGISSLADLADPDVAAAFDTDGNGRADLIGCDPDWACYDVVEQHLVDLGLTATVEQLSGDYTPRMQEAVARYRNGQPVLFYTYTPNWTTGELLPGADVAWLPVPDAAAPVEGVTGCLADPCPMGFEPSDIRSVANTELLDTHPAIRSLLDDFTVIGLRFAGGRPPHLRRQARLPGSPASVLGPHGGNGGRRAAVLPRRPRCLAGRCGQHRATVRSGAVDHDLEPSQGVHP